MLRLRNCTIVLALSLVVAAASIAARPKPAAKSDAPTQDANGQLVPPSDAQWTLYCAALEGPNHIQMANDAKAQLLKLTGLKDFYVIHQEGQSVIYYGFYRSISDAKDKKETDRAQRDLKTLETLTDTPGKPGGNKLFNHVFFNPVAEPDPAAPAEWNLATTGQYWSWQIAAYKDSPHRKQAAVDAVRDARKQGLNAYYYHGETTSSVCIGAWPKEAVSGEDDDVAGVATDPNENVLVMSQPLPNQEKMQFRNREGERIRDMTQRRKAIDPSLIAIMAQFPTHSINGETFVTKTNGKSVQDPAFLVKIKKPQPTLLRAAPQAPELIAPPPAPVVGSNPPPSGQGSGRLRSIGDQ